MIPEARPVSNDFPADDPADCSDEDRAVRPDSFASDRSTVTPWILTLLAALLMPEVSTLSTWAVAGTLVSPPLRPEVSALSTLASLGTVSLPPPSRPPPVRDFSRFALSALSNLISGLTLIGSGMVAPPEPRLCSSPCRSACGDLAAVRRRPRLRRREFLRRHLRAGAGGAGNQPGVAECDPRVNRPGRTDGVAGDETCEAADDVETLRDLLVRRHVRWRRASGLSGR